MTFLSGSALHLESKVYKVSKNQIFVKIMVVQGQHSGNINQVLKHATFKKTFASQKKKVPWEKQVHTITQKQQARWENEIVTENISLKASNRRMIQEKVYSLCTKDDYKNKAIGLLSSHLKRDDQINTCALHIHMF